MKGSKKTSTIAEMFNVDESEELEEDLDSLWCPRLPREAPRWGGCGSVEEREVA